MTDKELHILQHSLGLTKSKVSYRNHFTTDIGTDDYPICEKLVNEGYMTKAKYSLDEMGKSFIYFATEKGKIEISGKEIIL